MNKDEKVYCKDCKYHNWLMSVMNFEAVCGFEKKKKYFGYKSGVSCVEKNQNFDCKDFRKRWFK